MSKPQSSELAVPNTVTHALQPGEREQADRIFKRNAGLAELHPEDRRAFYATMSAQAEFADDVVIEPVSHDDARGWWIRPATPKPDKAVFFCHGGGYHLGDAKSYLGFASQIAAMTNCAVFSVDYALAPEKRFPAAFEDVSKARKWFVSQGFGQYSAIGDSAGGGLVLATASKELSGAKLASTVLFSPWTDLSNSAPSFRDPNTIDPVFHPAVLEGLAASYLGGADPRDPRASPLFGTAAWLPAINVQVGSHEILRDDSFRFAQLAAREGVDVRLDIFEGMYHVFQRDIGTLKTARSALEIAARFIGEHWTLNARPRSGSFSS